VHRAASVEFLLYSPFAVVLTLTHIYTPFAFLPIYASLEHIPRNLVEASPTWAHPASASSAR
jgi:ABC-type spermidine/putrescine transport system permease subunit I